MPVMIIGSAKRPRCFPSGWEPRRDAKVWYTSNKSAWMERTIFFIPLSLSQARAGSAEMKKFFHANQGEHPEHRKYMDAVEGIEKLLERMTFSKRSKQTTLFQHAFTAVSAADQPESAGRP